MVAVVLIAVLPGCVALDPTDPYTGISPRGHGEFTPVSHPTVQSVQRPITLAEAIDISLANNPELAATGYDVDAAGARYDEALGEVLPTIGFRGGYDYYSDRHRLGPPRYIGEHRAYSDSLFSSDLVLSTPLYAGGRLISEIDAAELLQAASEHRLVRNRQELVFNVSSVFYSILAQRHVIESLEFSRQALNEHLEDIAELIEARKAAKVDYLRTEVRIADLDQQLVKEQNVLAIQERVLTNLLGIARNGTDSVDVVGELAADTTATGDVEANVATALGRRGDYLAARAAMEAQAKRVDAARAERFPTVALEGSYGGRWAVGRLETNGDDPFDDVGSVGGIVDIPIFEGGRITARVREERANLAAARENLRTLELQVYLDVETALLNVSSSLQRVKATEKSIEQAKESLRIEREKYDFGKGAITDVLDAQSELLVSQKNYYRALADYNTAQAQLRLAVGEIQ